MTVLLAGCHGARPQFRILLNTQVQNNKANREHLVTSELFSLDGAAVGIQERCSRQNPLNTLNSRVHNDTWKNKVSAAGYTKEPTHFPGNWGHKKNPPAFSLLFL